MKFYVGTFSSDGSEGIYHGTLDPNSGALRIDGFAVDTNNPSYINFHPNGRFLYSANRVKAPDEPGQGWATAYAVDQASGALTRLNTQRTQGGNACYVSIDATGRYCLIAHYGTGHVSLLPVNGDGTLGEVCDVHQHEGSSVHPRQTAPHAHCIVMDPDNRHALAADLGIDKVMVWRLDHEAGRLAPAEAPWGTSYPGAGPRHIVFHPNGRFAYVIDEIGSSISTFAYVGRSGRLTSLQSVSTLPEGFEDKNTCADIHVHPSGRFVYGSNRGHDSIAIFRTAEDGTLTPIGHEPTRGAIPRGFEIDPTGRILIAANQDSNTLVSFRIDPEKGTLAATGHEVHVPKPVCVKFNPAAATT